MNNKYEMKLRRVSSHSYSVTIPKEIIKKFNWKERQKISIEELPGKVLKIKDWKRK